MNVHFKTSWGGGWACVSRIALKIKERSLCVFKHKLKTAVLALVSPYIHMQIQKGDAGRKDSVP